ncbi:MAG TPA: R3H domain-containing nucleic acid-binding protein [Candidatus Saccharimonadales bacterium]
MNQQQTEEYVKKYAEDLLAFFGVNIEVVVSTREDGIDVIVPNTDSSSVLIGRNGETLRSIQYLLSTVLRNNDAVTSRVNLDIADYKKQRAEKIAAQAREWIEGVRSTGDSYVARIGAADRRVVHQVATEYEDIQTFSEGEGRDRRIVIAQKSS